MKTIQILFLFLISLISVSAQSNKGHQNIPQILNKTAPTIEWAKCYGGSLLDAASSIIESSDGNYVVAGYTNSKDGDVTGNHGDWDFWVVKLNSTNGNIIWQKTYGGNGKDRATSIIESSDGNYVVAGFTNSNDGEVTGKHGKEDSWVVKISSIDGSIIWQKTYGGSQAEYFNSVIESSDGNYVVSGGSSSKDGDVISKNGYHDFWVVKISSIDGSIIWQKTYGGSQIEELHSIIESRDGNFVVVGWTSSEDGDVIGNHGKGDCWVVKISSIDGSIIWQKTYGGSEYDYALSIIESSDGNYVLAGETYSKDGDVTRYYGTADCWVIKIASTDGSIIWQKTYGVGSLDVARSIIESSDKNYVVAGSTGYNYNDECSDYWVIKIASTDGSLIWQKRFGGSSFDEAYSIIENNEGYYVVAGYVQSSDQDVIGNHGEVDLWVVKLLPEEDNGIQDFQSNQIGMNISPNPATDYINVGVQNIEPLQEIEIYNIFGERVLSVETQCIASLQKIDVSALPPGLYFLKVGNEKPNKFIKL